MVQVRETVVLDAEGCTEAKSKPHQTVVSGELVFVVDMGCDAVWTFRWAGEEISQVQRNHLGEGVGPRHMTLHPGSDLAFVVAEYQNVVLVLRLNPDDGSLTVASQSELSSVEGSQPKYGSEVLMGDTGDFLYVSSRSDDGGVLAVFSVDRNME